MVKASERVDVLGGEGSEDGAGWPVLSLEGERTPSTSRRRLAAGSSQLQPSARQAFRVVVRYREPTYERHNGSQPEPYVWAFKVRARSELEAVDRAIAEFRELARKSSVSWRRDIVGTTVEIDQPDRSGDT